MLLAGASVLLAPSIARLLGDDRLGPIIQVLSLVFVLVALTSIQMGLLRREMDFRGLAIRKLLAVGIGGAVGVAMAVMNFGPWALVGQQLTSAAVSVAALWAVTPWRPSLAFSAADFRSLFDFGLKVVAGDLLAFLSRNTDRLLIGVFLGPVALGFYAVAFRILDTSQILLVAAARRLIFPTFSRLQHDLDRARVAYLRVTRASSAITVPGYIGLALVAHEAIVVIFGPQWAPSATTAAILFLIGPALSLQAFSGAVWSAVGHPGVMLRFRLIATVVNIVGFVIAVFLFGNIAGVAAAFAVRAYLLLPLNLYWMRKYASVPVRDQLRQWTGVGIATAAMALAVLGVKFALVEQLSPALLLAAEVATGVVVYAVALVVVDRRLTRELITLAVQVLPGAGRVARRLGVPAQGPRRRAAGRGDAGANPLADDAEAL
jgi:O-antigen/teichoic acid export membrane protein